MVLALRHFDGIAVNCAAGRREEKSLHANIMRFLQQAQTRDHIDLRVRRRIAHRRPYIDLRGLMTHHLGLQFVYERERLLVAQVRFDERRARVDVVACARREIVDDAHAPAALEERVGDVRADEARAAGDEDVPPVHVARIVAFLRIARKTTDISAPNRNPPTCAHQAMPTTSNARRAACSERKPLKNCMPNQIGRNSTAGISAIAQYTTSGKSVTIRACGRSTRKAPRIPAMLPEAPIDGTVDCGKSSVCVRLPSAPHEMYRRRKRPCPSTSSTAPPNTQR